MIEQGLVKLVMDNSSVTAIAPTGGFLAGLPKDYRLPSWTYLVVSVTGDTMLQSVRGLAKMRLQIDCYGTSGDQVIRLASAIDGVLQGFSGDLTDSDLTWINSCLSSDMQDFPIDPEARTFRRMLEYEIWYTDASQSAGLRSARTAPTGQTVVISVGPSPFTYTAGIGMETVYISGGSATSVSLNGVPVADSLPIAITLQRLQSVTVTYDEAPTMVVDK